LPYGVKESVAWMDYEFIFVP